MKLNDISAAEYNPRKDMDEDVYRSLKGSIDKFGLVVPLIVNEETGTLVSGHQRLKALKEAGATEAEVVIISMTPEREKLLNIALNKIDGAWDYDKLADVIEDLSAEELPYTGFSDTEVDALLLRMEEEVDEIGTVPVQFTNEGFKIYLSFDKKETAERWLAKEGIAREFKEDARNLVVKMEG